MSTPRALPELRTERTCLRLPREEDISAILKFYTINKDYLAPWRPTFSEEFFTREFWQERIRDTHQQFQEGKMVRLLIFLREDEWNVVGSISFNELVRGSLQGCYLGYELARREQGKGIMSEALRAALGYMFETWNLHRVMANYVPHNSRSAVVLKRLGFVVEGYARDYLFLAGAWQDHILTSLTNPNWVTSDAQ